MNQMGMIQHLRKIVRKEVLRTKITKRNQSMISSKRFIFIHADAGTRFKYLWMNCEIVLGRIIRYLETSTESSPNVFGNARAAAYPSG
mmetsp:Transcript_10186/g.20276  ORF Transcript_10186/g.20276 Transcript_10186/m.20276 type:complete len:88 (+) Transcript_10186:919-1182(+)